MEVDEYRLLQGFMQGEKAAVEQAVRLYGDALFGYLVKLSGDRNDAEEYFQQTFCRICEKRTLFKGKSLKAWIFRIATNVVMDGFRKQKRESRIERVETYDCPNGPSSVSQAASCQSQPLETIQKEEQISMVRKIIDELPAGQRAVLVLSYYQQLSYSEVAEVLNCSIGSVKAQMFRALRKLADKLPDKGL